MSTAPPARHHSVLTRSLRRHVGLILLVTLLVTAVAGAFALTRSVTYTATSSVLLHPAPGNAFSSSATASSQQMTIALTTEAALVDSEPVLELAEESLPSGTSLDQDQVTGTVAANSQIVQIAVTGDTPEAAYDGARAVARALLTYRSDETAESLDARMQRLREQQATAQEKLDEATRDDSPRAGDLVNLYTEELANIAASIGALNATAADAGTIIKPAVLPSGPSSIPPWLLVLAGALLGAALGVALAVWRERGDTVVRADLESVGGRPVLATVPAPAPGRPEATEAAATSPSEGFRHARAAVLATAPPPSSIAVASSEPRDDTGLVAHHLALSLAKASYRVALVATSPHLGLESGLGLGSGPGVADVLAGGTELQEAIERRDGVDVLPFGSPATDKPDLFAQASFARLVRTLREQHDYVLVVTGPVSEPGAMDVAMATGSLILVCTTDQTNQESIGHEVHHATELGVSVLGALLVGRPRHRRRRSGSAAADGEAPTGSRRHADAAHASGTRAS